MNNTASKANSVFAAVMMTVIACLSYMALTGGPTNRLSPAIIILGTILYVYLGFRLKKLTDRINNKKDIPAYVITAVYFVLLVIASRLLTDMPVHSLADIQHEALTLLEKGKYSGSGHFAEYRQEIPMVLLHALVYAAGRLFGIRNYLYAGGIFTSFSIAAASLGLYFLVKHFKNSSDALWVMIAFVTNPVFFIYASNSDSNIVSMPWILWGNLLILKAFKDQTSVKKSRILLAAGAAVAAVSAVMLPENLIPTIAVVIYIFASKKGGKKAFAYLLIPVYLVLIMSLTDIALALGYKTDKDACFPPEHYVVIGINQYSRGWYSDYPIRLTRKFETYSEKREGDIEKIKESFDYMGVSDFANHTATKWKSTWGQGVAKESDLVGIRLPGTLYDYTVGSRSALFDYLIQVIRSGFLIFMLIAVTGDFIKKEKILSPFMLCFAIAVVFQMFWETSSISALKYIPWMLMFMPQAAEHIESAAAGIKKQITPEASAITGILVRSLAVGLTIINILVFATVRNGAVRDVDEYEDMVVFQGNQFAPKLSQLENNRYVQTFTAKREFNVISFNARIDTDSEKIFTIAIRDKNNKVVMREYFGQHDFNRYSSAVFKLDNTIKAGDYELIIKPIDYNRKIKKDPIVMSKIDYSPDRTLRANNRILNEDLNMQITCCRYRTMLPRKAFYGFTGLIILTEIGCTAELFIRKKKTGK